MNFEKYFTDQPFNKILKHHNAVYNIREVARTRQEKLNALQQQIDMLNNMNSGAKKVELDLNSNFSESDIEQVRTNNKVKRTLNLDV